MKSNVKTKIKIYIVQNHPVYRRGMIRLLNNEDNFSVSGNSDIKTSIDEITKLKPDLLIVDLSLKTNKGIDIIRKIKKSLPDINILVLSDHGNAFYVERAMQEGATCNVNKEEAPEKLLQVIKDILMK